MGFLIYKTFNGSCFDDKNNESSDAANEVYDDGALYKQFQLFCLIIH